MCVTFRGHPSVVVGTALDKSVTSVALRLVYEILLDWPAHVRSRFDRANRQLYIANIPILRAPKTVYSNELKRSSLTGISTEQIPFPSLEPSCCYFNLSIA